MNKFLAIAAAAAITSLAATAQASVVQFTGSPSTSWADGTFTTGLGPFTDGFYEYQGVTSAYNGYGQDGEEIFFNAPETLNSLSISKCAGCYDSHPTLYTVNLFDAASAFIGSQSAVAGALPVLLTFNTPGVKTIQFTYSGQDGTTPYGVGDAGRHPAWFKVSDITYGLGVGVPEPATWALMIGGFGLAGAALRRRRTALAA